MSNNNTLKTIIGTGFSRGYVLGTELILLLCTSVWMTPANRGIYIAGFAFLKTMTIVSSLSFGQIAIHYISERRHNSVGEVSGCLLLACIAFPVIALLGLYAYGYMHADFREIYLDPFLLLLMFGLPIFVLEIYFYAFLTALGRLDTGNKTIVIGKTLSWGSILMLGLVKGNLAVAEVLLLLVCGQLIIVIGYSCGLVEEFRRRAIKLLFSWRTFFVMLKKSLQLHPSIIGTVIFGGIDVLLVFKIAGSKSASDYQIAMQLLAALSILPFAIAQFAFKLVSQLGAGDAWARMQSLLLKTFVLHCVLAVLASLGISFIAENFFSGKYVEVSTLFMFIVMGAPGLFLGLVMAPFWIGFGYFSATSVLTILTGILMLPLCYQLTVQYGVKGTALAFVIGQILSVVINGLFIKHLRRINNG